MSTKLKNDIAIIHVLIIGNNMSSFYCNDKPFIYGVFVLGRRKCDDVETHLL